MIVLAAPDTVSVYWPVFQIALIAWSGGALWTWRGRPAISPTIGLA